MCQKRTGWSPCLSGQTLWRQISEQKRNGPQDCQSVGAWETSVLQLSCAWRIRTTVSLWDQNKMQMHFSSVWDQEAASGKWLLCAFLCLQPQHFQGVDRLRAVLLGRGPKKNRAVPGFFFLLGWPERLTEFLLKSQVWFSEGQLGFPPQSVVAHSGALCLGKSTTTAGSGHLVLARQSSWLQNRALVRLADNSGSRRRTLSEGSRKVRQCCHFPSRELRALFTRIYRTQKRSSLGCLGRLAMWTNSRQLNTGVLQVRTWRA